MLCEELHVANSNFAFWSIFPETNQAQIKENIYLHIARVKGEKAMATHSSTLAWKIPWTEEPGRL